MHACLFDIDGTLLLTGGAGMEAMRRALVEEFRVREPLDDVPMAGRTDRAITADLFERCGIPATDENWQRFFAAYRRHLPETLATLQGRVLPGIRELLRELQARDDVVLGLLTGNYAEGARLKLEHYGLERHFNFGGFGDHHEHRNDVARQAVAELRRRNGADAAGWPVWVIGDTPADVECGRAIGATVVAVCTGFYAMEALQAAEPDHLFVDFSDPVRLLDLLI